MRMLKDKDDYMLNKGCRCLIIGFMLFFVAVGNTYASAYGEMSPSETQQGITKVEGTVVDSNNEPLIGVSVTLKGGASKGQTITDFDGKYSINISGDRPSLVFSYIGFKDAVVLVDKRVINVTMKDEASELTGVVVVGYGTQKKENLTGAVFSVDLDKSLDSRPIADVGRGLQGVVPGLNIVLPNQEIGSDPVMKIRGSIVSLLGSTSPLILLDNVEIPSIQLVNPDDIESISVLKDAAASSIYGAKAAAGVILITSKKGSREGKVSVQYSNNFAWQKVSKEVEMADIEGLKYNLAAMKNSGQGSIVGAFFWTDDESIARAEEWKQKYGGKLGINDPVVFGRDWYLRADGYRMGVRLYNPADYMINDWAPMQTHNLTVSGTSDKTTYNIALGYLDQNSLLKPAKTDDFKRYNVSTRISTEINKYVTLRGSLLYSDRNKRSPYTGTYANDPWFYAYRWGSIMPWGVDESGNQLRSPVNEMAVANTAENQNKYTNLNVGATINFTKDWNVIADYTFSTNTGKILRPGRKFTVADLYQWSLVPRVDGFGNPVYVNKDGLIVEATDPDAMRAYDHPINTYEYTYNNTSSDSYYKGTTVNNSGTLNVYSTYNLNLGNQQEHAFKFMAGINRVDTKSDGHWTQITQIFDWNDPQMSTAFGEQTGGGSSGWEAQLGYFGRINYILLNKYLLEANLRYDGSSKFPKGKKWEWFPSFSAGWILSEEAFMKGLDPVLSFSKIRASWGSIGDQSVGSGFYLPLMSKRELGWLNGAGDKMIAFKSPGLIQEDLTWQRLETVDVGLDLRFWKNKIGLTVDWYQRKTKNMITTGPTVPIVMGAASPYGNYAELTTKGWEISADFSHRFENGLNINGTVAFYDSKSKFTDGYDRNDRSIWSYIGRTHGEIWGYETDRLYQAGDFARDANGNLIEYLINDPNSKYNGNKVYQLNGDNPVYQANSTLQSGSFMFQPGDVKYVDRNGDGYIDAGQSTIDDPGDMKVIGNTNPRYEYSIRLGADYKGFDVSVYSQGIGKRNLTRSGTLSVPGYAIGDGAMPSSIADNYWTPERTGAFYPRAYPTYGSNTSGNMQNQTRYLLDMSYFRIKNITLGYTCSEAWLKKAYLKQARIYVSLENFFTFDNLDGLPIDPEAVPGSSMFTSNNTDYNANRIGVGTPAFKTVSFGVQLNF